MTIWLTPDKKAYRSNWVVVCMLPLCFALGGCFIVPLVEPDAQGRGQSATVKSVSSGTITSERKRIPVASPKPSRVDKLVSNLQSTDKVTRTHAAFWLGELGPDAASAVPALTRSLLNDDSRWVRRASAKALGKIRSASAVQPLITALNDRDRWVAHTAANALRTYNTKESEIALSRYRGI